MDFDVSCKDVVLESSNSQHSSANISDPVKGRDTPCGL